jgi:hypothetical protein
MVTKAKREILDVSIAVRSGGRMGWVGIDTPERVAAVEKLVIEMARRCPDIPVRIVRTEVGEGKTFGFSHIPEKRWDAIFRSAKQGQD